MLENRRKCHARNPRFFSPCSIQGIYSHKGQKHPSILVSSVIITLTHVSFKIQSNIRHCVWYYIYLFFIVGYPYPSFGLKILLIFLPIYNGELIKIIIQVGTRTLYQESHTYINICFWCIDREIYKPTMKKIILN